MTKASSVTVVIGDRARVTAGREAISVKLVIGMQALRRRGAKKVAINLKVVNLHRLDSICNLKTEYLRVKIEFSIQGAFDIFSAAETMAFALIR